MARFSTLKPFKELDTGLFKLIDAFMASPVYGQIMQAIDASAHLDEDGRRILRRTVLVGLIVIFLVLIVVIFRMNSGLRQQILLKEQVLFEAENVLDHGRMLDQMMRELFSSLPISNQDVLNGRMRAIAKMESIPDMSLVITHFHHDNPFPEIEKISARISFKELSTGQLMRLLKKITVNEKGRIAEIKILKDQAVGTLSGEFLLIHIGRIRSLGF